MGAEMFAKCQRAWDINRSLYPELWQPLDAQCREVVSLPESALQSNTLPGVTSPSAGDVSLTETEWLACLDPEAILRFLGNKVSARKLRLFAVACCRRIWDLLFHDGSRIAVETAERFADGCAEASEITAAQAGATHVSYEIRGGPPGDRAVARAARSTTAENAWTAAKLTSEFAREAANLWATFTRCSPSEAESHTQADLLRDAFGNPFHSVSVDAAWLSDTSIVDLALSIYEDRSFSNMPSLADALEDAGCRNADILTHCRTTEGSAHVRGCWVVDLLLGNRRW